MIREEYTERCCSDWIPADPEFDGGDDDDEAAED